MPRTATIPGQMALPGMASHCPHCGSRSVEPSSDAHADDVSANQWCCRRCRREWWQMAPPEQR